MSNREIFLTRRVCFCAAHRLYNAHWSKEKNWDVFDKCSYENGHGHNYELFVTLKGSADSDSGMLINVNEVSEIVEKAVINDLDHKNLNLDVPEFKTLLPSIENLVIVIWDRLIKQEKLAPYLYEIKVQETENNIAYYRG